LSNGNWDCSECRKERAKKWEVDNKEKLSALRRASRVKRVYNLDTDIRENAQCAICGTKQFNGHGACIDHDHNTGSVRGVLCHDCNVGIGFLKTIKNLENAIIYLRGNEHE